MNRKKLVAIMYLSFIKHLSGVVYKLEKLS